MSGKVDFFQGRGRPIAVYAVKEAAWPDVWRMPDEAMEHEDADNLAMFADDVVLRAIVNCWDNCARLPGSESSIGAGVVGALARFLVGLNPDGDLEKFEAIGASLRFMAEQYRDIARNGWFGDAEDDDA